jgi:ribosomal protein S27AE
VSFFEIRPSCPKCGMNMVKIGTRFECLRCGHVEKPAAPNGVDRRADKFADPLEPAMSRTACAAANWPSG